MTDLAPSLAIGASALILHMAALTALVAYFRDVRDTRWVRVFLGARAVPRTGLKRWIGAVFAGGTAALATSLMVFFLFGGAHMSVIGAAELIIALLWLRYVLAAG